MTIILILSKTEFCDVYGEFLSMFFNQLELVMCMGNFVMFFSSFPFLWQVIVSLVYDLVLEFNGVLVLLLGVVNLPVHQKRIKSYKYLSRPQ